MSPEDVLMLCNGARSQNLGSEVGKKCQLLKLMEEIMLPSFLQAIGQF